MGKSSPSAPSQPSPAAQAAAQTQSNKDTALYNFGLNNPNVTSPLGNNAYNLTYDENGNPQSNQTITLSQPEQTLFDQANTNAIQEGQIANQSLQGIQNTYNTPYDLSSNVSALPSQQDLNKDYQNQYDTLYKQQSAYLDPQWQNTQKQQEATLANQGVVPGSEAYNNAMDELNRNKTFAYQQAADQAQAGAGSEQTRMANLGLANQQQQAQMYTQQYQEPLNLYTSLTTGSQPTLPQFSSVNQSSAQPTNVLGAYQNAYNSNLNSYNAKVGANNSATSGLFGLGGSLGAAGIMAMSDRRLKKNAHFIGWFKNGLPKYVFEYIWDAQKHVGAMADEVKKFIPEAVIKHESGFDMVNYAMVGE